LPPPPRKKSPTTSGGKWKKITSVRRRLKMRVVKHKKRIKMSNKTMFGGNYINIVKNSEPYGLLTRSANLIFLKEKYDLGTQISALNRIISRD
jgi:hypothetical protein